MKIEIKYDRGRINTLSTPRWIYRGNNNYIRKIIKESWDSYYGDEILCNIPSTFPTYFSNVMCDSYPEKVSKRIKYNLLSIGTKIGVKFYKLQKEKLTKYLNGNNDVVVYNIGNIKHIIADVKIDDLTNGIYKHIISKPKNKRR